MTSCYRLYNEKDIKIHENGILVKDTFFDRKKIADVFNELVITHNFIENMDKK